MDKKKKIRTIVILLATLNIIILILLFLVKCNPWEKNSGGVSVDIIKDNSFGNSSEITESSVEEQTSNKSNGGNSATSSSTSSSTSEANIKRKSSSTSLDIELTEKGSSKEALPLVIKNMFPGDSIEQTYNLAVEYNSSNSYKPTLYFYCYADNNSDIILTEGLLITLEMNNKVLWQGKASEIYGEEKAISQNLLKIDDSYGKRNYNWDVSLKAELPTSAGNEYQNKKLVLDFVWMLEGKEASKPSKSETKEVEPINPNTGSEGNVLLWVFVTVALFVLSIFTFLFLPKKRRKGAEMICR